MELHTGSRHEMYACSSISQILSKLIKLLQACTRWETVHTVGKTLERWTMYFVFVNNCCTVLWPCTQHSGTYQLFNVLYWPGYEAGLEHSLGIMRENLVKHLVWSLTKDTICIMICLYRSYVYCTLSAWHARMSCHCGYLSTCIVPAGKLA